MGMFLGGWDDDATCNWCDKPIYACECGKPKKGDPGTLSNSYFYEKPKWSTTTPSVTPGDIICSEVVEGKGINQAYVADVDGERVIVQFLDGRGDFSKVVWPYKTILKIVHATANWEK